MNLKKIAAVSALVLLLAGCVLVAGCTDSTTTTTAVASDVPVVDTDSIVGNWGTDPELVESMLQSMKNLAISLGTPESEINLDELREQISDLGTYQFNADGTGAIVTADQKVEFTWKSLGNNKFGIIYDNVQTDLTFDPATGKFADASGMIALKKLAE